MTPTPAALDQLRALLAELRQALKEPSITTAGYEAGSDSTDLVGALTQLREQSGHALEAARAGMPVMFGLPAEFVGAAVADLLDRVLAWFGLHPQERAFLHHLAEDRLSYTAEVFADWLDDHGRDTEGRRLRLLRPRPGDVVAYEMSPGRWPPDIEEQQLARERLAADLRKAFPGAVFVIIPHGSDVRTFDPGQMRAAGWVRADEAAVQDVMADLAELGMPLPDDTTAENFLERMNAMLPIAVAVEVNRRQGRRRRPGRLP